MAISANSFVSDEESWAYAKLRYPAVFTAASHDNAWTAEIVRAADFINQQNYRYYGQTLTTNTGGKVWPRMPRTESAGYTAAQVAEDRLFTGVGGFLHNYTDQPTGYRVPEGIKNAQIWIAISQRLDPIVWGATTSSGTTTITTAGGIKTMKAKDYSVEYYTPSTRTSTVDRSSDATGRLLDQILEFLNPFLLPGEDVNLPSGGSSSCADVYAHLYVAPFVCGY